MDILSKETLFFNEIFQVMKEGWKLRGSWFKRWNEEDWSNVFTFLSELEEVVYIYVILLLGSAVSILFSKKYSVVSMDGVSQVKNVISVNFFITILL